MKILIILFSISIVSLAESLKGTAKNETGAVVYTEVHRVVRSSGGFTCTVATTYYNPDGSKLGHLNSEFKEHLYIPDSQFEDLRFGRKYIGKVSKNGKKLVYQIDEFRGDKLVKSTEVELEDDLISGPGFDNFISEELIKQKKAQRPVHFLVLPRHSSYRFTVSQIDSQDEATRTYKIKPNALLSLFIKDIVISYDGKTGILKQYSGLSNLPAANDTAQNVVINYEKIDDLGSAKSD